VVLTDLLKGVAVGLGVALLIIIRMNHHQAITVVNDGNLWLVRFAKDVSFAHKARLKKILAAIPDDSTVVIDGVGAAFIDLDILEEIRDFIEFAPERGVRATWKNLRSKRFSIRGRRDGELQEPSFGK
jgi:MFS superfamily sulfate permease-like transporter